MHKKEVVKITKIEVDKALLKVMMNEYWAVDNNSTCTTATVWFLRKIGYDENDISDIIDEEYTESDIEEIKKDIERELMYID